MNAPQDEPHPEFNAADFPPPSLLSKRKQHQHSWPHDAYAIKLYRRWLEEGVTEGERESFLSNIRRIEAASPVPEIVADVYDHVVDGRAFDVNDMIVSAVMNKDAAFFRQIADYLEAPEKKRRTEAIAAMRQTVALMLIDESDKPINPNSVREKLPAFARIELRTNKAIYKAIEELGGTLDDRRGKR